MIISLLASISVDVSVLYVCLISGDLVLDTYSNFIPNSLNAKATAFEAPPVPKIRAVL